MRERQTETETDRQTDNREGLLNELLDPLFPFFIPRLCLVSYLFGGRLVKSVYGP